MIEDDDILEILMRAPTPMAGLRTILNVGIEIGITQTIERMRAERDAAEIEEVGTVDDADDYFQQLNGDYRTR